MHEKSQTVNQLILPNNFDLLGTNETLCMGHSHGKHTTGKRVKISNDFKLIISFYQVLRIQPNNEKALFRKAKILQEKHQLDEAIG